MGRKEMWKDYPYPDTSTYTSQIKRNYYFISLWEYDNLNEDTTILTF
jgi:hypothetical protein